MKRLTHRSISTLGAVTWRYLLVHYWQTILMIVGVALGVAVIVSIDLANAAASRAFQLSTETISGKATDQITSTAGSLDEKIYSDLLRSGVHIPAAPIISSLVASPQLGGRPLQLLGIDPFSDGQFRNFWNDSSSVVANLSPFFTQPGALVISKSLANTYSLKPGDSIQLLVDGRQKTAFIAAVINPQSTLTRRVLDGIVLADISTAQELSGKVGKLDWIDLILPVDSTTAKAQLQAILPEGSQIAAVSAKAGALQEMTSAFQLNLTVLSLLSLMVGLFLIYNTMTFSVIHRRPLFGTLRAIGVTRGELFRIVVGEAALVGVVGGGLGVGLGILMGQATVQMVNRTINDLYFATTISAGGIAFSSLIKGFSIGVIATVVAASIPAWEAASSAPTLTLSRSGLESRTQKTIKWVTLVGLGLIGVSLALFSIRSKSLMIGLGGTALAVLGMGMLAAPGLVVMMKILSPGLESIFGMIGKMAPRNLIASLSRTSVSVAALMIAVAVTIGVTLMIDSFRYTVTVWLAQTLQGDVYISVPTFVAAQPSAPLDGNLINTLNGYPNIERINLLRSLPIQTQEGVTINLSATDNPKIGSERLYVWRKDDPDTAWKQMLNGSVMISEPFANRLQIDRRGGVISINTPLGVRQFQVEGVYHDYSSSEGGMLMAMDVYRKLWNDIQVTAIDLRLRAGVSPDAMVNELRQGIKLDQSLVIRSNQGLRKDVMEVFDRTFAITSALRILATIVAFMGVLNSVLLLQLEKQREIGILRAIGLTGRQLWALTMLETGLMGLTAGVLAIPTGYALALILINVINQRSFGWSLQMMIRPSAFIEAVGLAIVAALLAGVYPAWRLSRMPANEAIRYE